MNKKKLLYIFFGGSTDMSSGVMKKIINKIKTLNQLGFSTEGVSFSDKIDKIIKIDDHICIYPVRNVKGNLFKTTRIKRNTFIALNEYLKNNITNFENVFFRYPFASLHLLRLVNRYSNKIIFEHNTKETEELISNWRYSDLIKSTKLKLGYYLSTLEEFIIPILTEKYLSCLIFKKARFGISVTNEIAEYEKNKCNGKYKNFVISNGIKVDSVLLKKTYTKDKPKVFIMLLGSLGHWQGEERLIEGLDIYTKKDNDVILHLVGNIKKSTIELINILNLNNKVIITPNLYGKRLDEVIDNSSIAFGSLAIYIKRLTEASPLKTREYLARGIPVVVGYYDTDIEENPELKKYCLHVPADNTPINIEDVLNFEKNVYKNNNVHQTIRNLAYKYIDTSVKMKQLIQTIKNN